MQFRFFQNVPQVSSELDAKLNAPKIDGETVAKKFATAKMEANVIN